MQRQATSNQLKNYMKTDSRLKFDTNQLQNNLKTDTCPACPCPKSDSSVQLAWCCCVGFSTTQQVSVFELSESAVGFYIIVLLFLNRCSDKPPQINMFLCVGQFYKNSNHKLNRGMHSDWCRSAENRLKHTFYQLKALKA